jgi:hypothetical protein
MTPDNMRTLNNITNTKKADNIIRSSVNKNIKIYNTEEHKEEQRRKKEEALRKRLTTLANKKK